MRLIIVVWVTFTIFLGGSSNPANGQSNVQEAWMNSYAYSGPDTSGVSYDDLVGHGVDEQGNIYIAGLYFRENYDYLIAKYNPDGLILWTAYYDFGDQDVPSAMCLDELGNVYVTGRSRVGSQYDYATVKFNAGGEQIWEARTEGGFSNDDVPVAIAFDDAGNVYVTGTSYSPPSGDDYLTVKYDGSGTEQWTVRYNNSSTNGIDKAVGLVLDSAGNVYVTGGSYGGGTGYDYATVKYSSAGQQLWIDRYDHNQSEEYPSAMTIDAMGNIYITGLSRPDYATIKHNGGGMIEWIARYDSTYMYLVDSPRAILADSTGAVYVAGTSRRNYLTIKYNAFGQELWSAVYRGPVDRDIATDLVVDSFANVYVTGWSRRDNSLGPTDFTTVKYNSSGSIQWIVRDHYAQYPRGPLLAFDPFGYLILGGYIWDHSDYAVVKYSADGAKQWAAVFQEDYTFYQPQDIVLDNQGDAYLTGFFFNPDSSRDFITLKYSEDGNAAWAARYNGAADGEDLAEAIAMDAAGNIYVAGQSEDMASGDDYTVIKYNPSGQQEWVVRYDGPASGNDHATDIAVDDAGNVYVTGRSAGAGSGDDYATIKYDANGVQQWVSRYNGPDNSTDYASAIMLDDLGNVYVTGSATGQGTSRDYLTIKYSPNGIELWTARHNGLANDIDDPVALAVDDDGDVYVTGTSWGGQGQNESYWDYATVKYDANGNEQWVARYDSPGGNQLDDFAEAIEIDDQGNVYVTGGSMNANFDFDYATVKYNSNGSLQWAARHDGNQNGDDWAKALAIDPLGNIYVSGYSDSGEIRQFSTLKHESDGSLLWEMRKSHPQGSSNQPAALSVDELGNIYVAGYSGQGSDWRLMTTIRYIQDPPVGVDDEPAAALPDKYVLYQNQPNPFNPTTTFRYAVPKSGHVKLQIFNVLGQEVATLLDEQLPAGDYSVSWDAGQYASGVYLYRLEAEGFAQTKKLLLLK